MTGNESTQIPPHGENVFHWERTEIEEAFTPLDPKNAHSAAMNYSNAATQWDQGLETFARSVQGSIAESWEGSAADKAKDAITRYVKDAHELTPLITQMSNDMEAAADAIRSVATGIPEANHHSWTANVWPPRATEEEHTRSEATAGARNAMLENYVKKFAEFDGRVPVLPTALNPTNPLDISEPTKPTGTGDGSGNPSGSGNPTSPGSTEDPKETDENPEEEKKTEEESTDDPSSEDTNPSSTNPTSTDPSSSPTTPTALDPSKSGTPTTPAGTPSGLGSPGGGTPGSPSTPSPGRSVPGVPGTPTGANPAAAAASRLAGGTGMPGMGGMGAGAGKGKSDDENTHGTPDYLINAENTAELIGEIAPTVPGGVIGGDVAPPPPTRN
ncbi:WXG100 family type VII secretion target [Nocardia sp. NPDC057440]|uniref:WXG100 family type VII secretion target n=1 Tax=Nocardia sp. NPDC057440 TaxID=3346134 RepID=UPI00366D79FD